MKQINTEENLGNPTSKRQDSAGGGKVPQLGIYIPSFTPLKFVAHQEAGNGAISFGELLADQGNKLYENQMRLYDNEEMSEAIEEVETQFQEQDKNFWQNNKSGKGYTDFVNQTYGDLVDSAISNHSYRVKDRLQEHFKAKRTALTQNAFLREQEVYGAYTLNKVDNRINDLTKKVIDNPELAEVTWNDISVELSSAQGVLPPQTFDNYFEKVKKDYAKTVAHAQITRDPDTGLAMLEKGGLFKEFLDAKEYEHMLSYAQHTKESRRREERAQANFILRKQRYQENNELINGKTAFLNGDEGPLNKMADSTDVSEQTREKAKQIRSELVKKKTKKERNYEIMDAYVFKDENIGLNEITNSSKDEWFYELINNENTSRKMNDGENLSLQEIVAQKESLPYFFKDHKDTDISSRVSMTLQKSTDANELKDAAITVANFGDSKTLSMHDDEGKPSNQTLANCIAALWDTRKDDITNMNMVQSLRTNIETYSDKEIRKQIDTKFAKEAANYNYDINNEILAPLGATKEVGAIGRFFNKEIEWEPSLDNHEQILIKKAANTTIKNAFIATRDYEAAKDVTKNVLNKMISTKEEVVKGKTVQIPKWYAFDNNNKFCKDDNDARRIMNGFTQGVLIKQYNVTENNQANGRKLRASEIYSTCIDQENRVYAFYHYNKQGEKVYLIHNNTPIKLDYSNVALTRLRKIRQSIPNKGTK